MVGGLATEYCVRATVVDARRAGFDVVVVTDGIRALDRTAGDGQRAIDDMIAAGAATARAADIFLPI